MSKFDYVIQNPPYLRSYHLDFFKKGLEIVKKDGKMNIIEPSTWLLKLNPSSTYNFPDSICTHIKQTIEKHTSTVIIENLNYYFKTNLYVPFSITHIDFSKQFNFINFYNCGNYSKETSIYDCNLIGNHNIINSILNKCRKFNTANSRRYFKNKVEGNFYFCKYAYTVSGPGSQMCAVADYGRKLSKEISEESLNYDNFYIKTTKGEFLHSYFSVMFHRYKNEISNKPLTQYDKGKHETNILAKCFYGSKEELENWKYYIHNNSLPLFINICMTIDQNNMSLDCVPWIVDKKYTDEELYNKLNLSENEIKFINKTIERYRRTSRWFIRYMIGTKNLIYENIRK